MATVSPAAAAPTGRPSAPHLPSVQRSADRGVVKDSYIVVLKAAKASSADVNASARALVQRYGGSVSRTYSHSIRGFAARMSAAQAKQLATNADVAYVEPNRKVSASDTQINPPSWGLDRLEQIFAPLNKRYVYPNTASNVHAYVIDTGIRISHVEFGGRASYGYDFIDNDAVADDCAGHGTHVAGTIGGTNYGVAKAIQLVGVRVLDCSGSGTDAEVIAGVDWVTAHAVKPAVANMSLGGDASAALDAAVEASIASGISYSVAAGNEADDACNYSPSRTSNAITVGATDEVDFRLTFSNYGSCVDIHAPGNNIPSSVIASDTAIDRYTGTSMASPHVAGAAALALSANPTWTPTQVRNFLVYGGTRRVVRNTAATSWRPVTTDVILRVGNLIVPFVTGLRSLTNGKNVSVGATGTSPLQPLLAPNQIGDSEKFTSVNASGGYYAFASWVNGKYVSATSGGTGSLIANASTITDAERFLPQMNGDGTVSLINKLTGNYVTAPNNGGSPLLATAPTLGQAEKFIWASPAAVVSLRAPVNNKLVTTPNYGASALIASATTMTYLEQFDMLDMNDDAIVLRAHSDKKYVTATSNGVGSLVANSTTIGPAQTFWLYHWGDGSLIFQSALSYDLVQAANNGNSPLIANWDPSVEPGVTTQFFYEPVSVN